VGSILDKYQVVWAQSSSNIR